MEQTGDEEEGACEREGCDDGGGSKLGRSEGGWKVFNGLLPPFALGLTHLDYILNTGAGGCPRARIHSTR